MYCSTKTLIGLSLLGVLMITVQGVAVGETVGPGNIDPIYNDFAGDMIVIDLSNPADLLAGEYTASYFNYQFSEGSGNSGITLGGSVQPLLAKSTGTNIYMVIALGDFVTYAGDTSFVSTPFDGTDSFTLATDTTVFAGFYYDQTAQLPIGYITTDPEDSFARWNGANAPVVDTVISGGGHVDHLARLYDFSVTVVPEPHSITLLLCGLASLICWSRK